ncbi:MAG: zinc-binding dehydrogenase [Candidatus Sumerlaeota bacterium]|nr:zinc-binding dehydrogenase [Candidatus Sumerlaeota bacterium]
MKSLAVVFTAPNTVEVQTIDCPDPGPADVVVRVTRSWISNGTEGSMLRGERVGGDIPRRPGDPWPFPVVAGYQKVGVVERVGEGVKDLAVGEAVFAATSKVAGMFHKMGGHVSPAVTPRQAVWKLPQDRDPLAFSGLVLTQVGYNCGARAPLEAGDGAVVLGDGMVGQWAAQTLAWRGAEVLLVGRHDDRLARFPPGRGRRTLNEKRADWIQSVREQFPKGVRVAVDTVGSIPGVMALRKCMARFGHIVSAGFYGANDQIGLQPFRLGEISLDFVSGWHPERMRRTMELIASGDLDTLGLITHRFPVSQAAEGWQVIREKRENALGVILEW